MAKGELAGLKDEERKWKIQDAADTLVRVLRIKKDKELHKAAVAELKERRDAINTAIS